MNITFTKDGGNLVGNQWDGLIHAVMVEIEEIVARLEETFGLRDATYSSIFEEKFIRHIL